MSTYSKVYDVIKSLRATSSKIAKANILKAESESSELRAFFSAALDPFSVYFIKKIPDYDVSRNPTMTFGEALVSLNRFRTREVTGFAAIDALKMILSSLHEHDAELIELIIKKDPDCGCQRNSVNDVWAKLIPNFPVLLCSAFNQKLVDKLDWKRGVIVQLKSDGARCNIVVDAFGGVEVFSRAGRPIEVKGRFNYLGVTCRNVMIDGELLVRQANGTPMSRKEGNGIVNKAIKNTISQEEANCLYLMAWDTIPLDDFKAEECSIEYVTRIKDLQQIVADSTDSSGIQLIPSTVVHSFEEAMKICQEYYDAGEEGAILKDMSLPWSSKRSKLAIKLKQEIDCDLEVIGYQDGKDRYDGLLGALICATRDRKLKVDVGGGYSIKRRAQLEANYRERPVTYTLTSDGIVTEYTVQPNGERIIGQILPVRYNMIITSGDSVSLFLPRTFNDGAFRLDKFVADSLDELS